MQAIQDFPHFDIRIPSGSGRADVEERNRNMQNEAIAQIAKETGWRAEDIGSLYRWVFHDLEQNAQVRDYLFVLAAKRVKRILTTRRLLKTSH